MNNILTITGLTFREAFAKKIFIFFFVMSTIVLLILTGIFSSTDATSLTGVMRVRGPNHQMVGSIVGALKLILLTPLYGLGLFLSIFSASSFIPDMLEKGNIDLLLSKPISRAQIIIGKFFGGSIIVFLNVAYLVFGLWLLLGYNFNDWSLSLLLAALIITFTFMLLYSLMILLGILSKSSVLSMMVSFSIFVVFSPLLAARETFGVLIESEIVKSILNVLYYIIPQTSELGTIMNSVALGKGIENYSPIIVSSIFMLIMISGSIIIFNKNIIIKSICAIIR